MFKKTLKKASLFLGAVAIAGGMILSPVAVDKAEAGIASVGVVQMSLFDTLSPSPYSYPMFDRYAEVEEGVTFISFKSYGYGLDEKIGIQLCYYPGFLSEDLEKAKINGQYDSEKIEVIRSLITPIMEYKRLPSDFESFIMP